MKWIKASARLPLETKTYYVRQVDKKSVRYIVPHALNKDEFIAEGFEWLDESEEPDQDEVLRELDEYFSDTYDWAIIRKKILSEYIISRK